MPFITIAERVGMEKGLLLRFDDGKERVILERFLTKLSS